jgi:hypothetical protein
MAQSVVERNYVKPGIAVFIHYSRMLSYIYYRLRAVAGKPFVIMLP